MGSPWGACPLRPATLCCRRRSAARDGSDSSRPPDHHERSAVLEFSPPGDSGEVAGPPVDVTATELAWFRCARERYAGDRIATEGMDLFHAVEPQASIRTSGAVMAEEPAGARR